MPIPASWNRLAARGCNERRRHSGTVNLGPGDKVADYRLEEQIGEGGMAVVYRARDERLNRQVALKLLTPSLTTDAAFRTRFARESRVVAAVEHPNSSRSTAPGNLTDSCTSPCDTSGVVTCGLYSAMAG